MKKNLENTLQNLREDKIILYPTDTIGGVGCDATNEEVVSKIYKIKQREESKTLIILVASIDMLQKYVAEVPDKALEVLEKVDKPTTIIYKNPIGLAKNVIASDDTVAIRVVQDKFCHELITRFNKPIVSTSANISGKPTPKSFKEIDQAVLDAVDYVVNLYQNEVASKSSRIIQILDDGTTKVLRD